LIETGVDLLGGISR